MSLWLHQQFFGPGPLKLMSVLSVKGKDSYTVSKDYQ